MELKRVRGISGSINYNKGVGESFFQEGVLQYKKNKYEAALESFDSALKIAE